MQFYCHVVSRNTESLLIMLGSAVTLDIPDKLKYGQVSNLCQMPDLGYPVRRQFLVLCPNRCLNRNEVAILLVCYRLSTRPKISLVTYHGSVCELESRCWLAGVGCHYNQIGLGIVPIMER
jgi:hypothetical protein